MELRVRRVTYESVRIYEEFIMEVPDDVENIADFVWEHHYLYEDPSNSPHHEPVQFETEELIWEPVNE